MEGKNEEFNRLMGSAATESAELQKTLQETEEALRKAEEEK